MDEIRIDEVRALLRARSSPCISIYLTGSTSIPGGREDRIRARNLLRNAAQRLARRYHRREIDRLLVPLVRRMEDHWPRRGCSLALLRSPELDLAYQIPFEVGDLAVVASTFHTKPLVRHLDRSRRFFVLAIGERWCRLYQGTPASIQELAPERVSAELRDLLVPGREPEAGSFANGLGARTLSPRASSRSVRQQRLSLRFRALDRAVGRALRDTGAPLVLAGAAPHLATYRAVARYPWLLDEDVRGHAEGLPSAELHARASLLLSRHQVEVESAAAAQYLAASGTGKASDWLAEIARGAAEGRVRLLLHREGAILWGQIDPRTGAYRLRQEPLEPGDADVIDDLCEMTLLRGGGAVEVAPERMPTDVPVAAIFRY